MRLRLLTACTLAACASGAAAATACQSTTAPASGEHVDLASVLPAGPPYITGPVVARDNRFTHARSARIATSPRDPQTGRSADVILEDDVTVVHRDGRRAGVDDVRPGLVVTVWVGPTELRSLPPVVDGRVLVIEP